MGRKKNITSEMDVIEKANSPFAKRLSELIAKNDNAKELEHFLRVSPQAISQYKNGESRPSLDNICKIADFYKVTVDFLLGRTSVDSTDYDIQRVHEYTGLSSNAIIALNNLKNANQITAKSDVLSIILESDEFDYILGTICYAISASMDNCTINPYKEDPCSPFSNDVLLKSLINLYMVELIKLVEIRYIEKFSISPDERKKQYWEAKQRSLGTPTPMPSSEEVLNRIRNFEHYHSQKNVGKNGHD